MLGGQHGLHLSQSPNGVIGRRVQVRERSNTLGLRGRSGGPERDHDAGHALGMVVNIIVGNGGTVLQEHPGGNDIVIAVCGRVEIPGWLARAVGFHLADPDSQTCQHRTPRQ